MRGPNAKAFKQGFLKNWILSLQAACVVASSSGGGAGGTMSLQERKRAIKSSADIAMATSRGGGARWPRAILLASSSSRPPRCKTTAGKVRRCNKIVRRCFRARRWPRDASTAGGGASLARRLVRKRTKVLRKMIPGGELLDEVSLLHEAVDYVEHLHAQVAVLRRISNAVLR